MDRELEKDLIIDVSATEISFALTEDHRLIEFSKEQNGGKSFSVGDVYLGKVKKIIPSLNAAFIDIGDEKDAFVHYLDLGFNFKAFDYFAKQINPNCDYSSLYKRTRFDEILEKEGKIDKYLQQGQPIIVQIVKEPISTKGSRLTSEISIAGRNMVLLPFGDKISISQKISSKEERRRLERLVHSILPTNYGVIIRTAAEGKKAAVLDVELKSLIQRWESCWDKIAQSKSTQLLFTETSRTTTILRDLLNDSFSNIYVNDEIVFHEVKDYVMSIAPDQEKIVKLYKGAQPIFEHFDISRQIKSSFGRVVPMKKGSYIIIEHTEAMHVIDVNSGIRVKQGEQEQNAYDVNLVAAEEIVRQLRLRDMGGIIIIDFIDMEENEHKNLLYKRMVELMHSDRAKHNILPLTRFGLMQITRQRVRPVTEINTMEACPSCGGTGKINSSLIFDETIERYLAFYVKEKGIKSFTLSVNPIIEAYLTKGLFSIRYKWCQKYKCSIKVKADSGLALMQFVWANKNGEKIED